MFARSRVLAVMIAGVLLAPSAAHAAVPSPGLARYERLARVRSATVTFAASLRRFRPGRSRLRPPASGVTRFDQTDARLTYSTGWSRRSVPFAFGRTISIANGAAGVDIPFEGTAVNWLAVKGPTGGIARLWLDGWPAGDVDLYRKESFSDEPVWAAAGLLPGVQHHLRIEWTGTRNAAALDDLVTVDGFDVRGVLARDLTPPVTTDDVAGHDPYVDSAEVSLTAVDDGLGVAWTGYSVDGGVWTTGTVLSVGTLGEHTIAYRSIDLAGNVEETRTVTLHVRSSDVTPPVTSTDATAGPSLDTVTIRLSATDDRTGVASTMFRVDEGAWTSGTVVTIAGAGEHVLGYRSVDVAGNVEQTRTVDVPVAQRYRWDDAQLGYVGSWQPHATLWNELWSLGSVTATFTGTRIEYYSNGRYDQGLAAVSLDGAAPVLVDPALAIGPDWSSGKLPYGRHVVRIVWTGEPGSGYLNGWPSEGYISLSALYVVGQLDASSTPSVAWSDWLTPPEGAVLYSDPVDPGRTLVWQGAGAGSDPLASFVASANSNAAWPPIERVRMSVDTTPGYPFNVLAEWTPQSRTFVNDGSMGFDPQAVVLPLSQGLAAPYIPDGRRTFRVWVWDAGGTYAEDVRMLRVDNHPPDGFDPASPIALGQPARNTDRFVPSLELGWAPPLDGTDPVDTYRLTIAAFGSEAATFGPAQLGGAGSALVTSAVVPGLALAPFTPYQVRLTPLGPMTVGTPSASSTIGVTAPRLTGSVFNQAVNKKALPNYRFDLAVSAPAPGLAAAFGGTTVVYDVWSMSATTYTYSGYGDLPATAYLETISTPARVIEIQSGTVCEKYLQVEAKILAADGVTVLKRVRSNVVGPPAVPPLPVSSEPLPIP